jgi:hypothetical protein
MKKFYVSILLLGVFILSTGFNLDNAIVPTDQILAGGPPKDGIPAILEPKFIRPEQADFLEESDPVIGMVVNGVAKAYPLKILNWHEVVNDTVNGIPIAVTF